MTNQTRLPLDSKKAAAKAGVSRSTFWRGVASGRFPQPVYPMPGSPRWFDDELIAAVEKTRMSPAEAKEERRRCRLARDAAPLPKLSKKHEDLPDLYTELEYAKRPKGEGGGDPATGGCDDE